jgi:hypothetical protein
LHENILSSIIAMRLTEMNTGQTDEDGWDTTDDEDHGDDEKSDWSSTDDEASEPGDEDDSSCTAFEIR